MNVLRKDDGAKNEQGRASYPRNATSGACSGLAEFTYILFPRVFNKPINSGVRHKGPLLLDKPAD